MPFRSPPVWLFHSLLIFKPLFIRAVYPRPAPRKQISTFGYHVTHSICQRATKQTDQHHVGRSGVTRATLFPRRMHVIAMHWAVRGATGSRTLFNPERSCWPMIDSNVSNPEFLWETFARCTSRRPWLFSRALSVQLATQRADLGNDAASDTWLIRSSERRLFRREKRGRWKYFDRVICAAFPQRQLEQ